MLYKFSTAPTVTFEDKVIFIGDNSQGVWENGILMVQNGETKYIYQDGEWFIETIFTETPLPCGIGAVPTLQIDNLQQVNPMAFTAIQYVAENE